MPTRVLPATHAVAGRLLAARSHLAALLLVCGAVSFAPGVRAGDPGGVDAGTTDLALELRLRDGVVLQRGRPIAVRGRATPDATVEARLGADVASALADPDGRFTVLLPPRAASAVPVRLEVTCAAAHAEVVDVLIGDVWLAAGLGDGARRQRAEPARPQATLAPVRVFVPRAAAVVGDVVWTARERRRARTSYLAGRWCDLSDAAAHLPAAFARELALELAAGTDVPVGVLQLSTGAAPLDSWVPRPGLLGRPVLARRLGDWWEAPEVPEALQRRARRNLAGAFDRSARVARAGLHPFQPGFLWDQAALAVQGVAVAGVVWSSGPLATDAPEDHGTLLRLLVDSWRDRVVGEGTPFVLVESAVTDLLADPEDDAAARRRDVERRIASGPGALPGVVRVVTRDLASRVDAGTRTAAIARRVARAARSLASDVGGEGLAGPAPVAWTVDPVAGEARVAFEPEGRLSTSDGDPLRDVWVVGSDGEPRRARARLEAGELVASHPEVRLPVEVRYGWGAACEGNLVDAEGRPAPTFRLVLTGAAVVGIGPDE